MTIFMLRVWVWVWASYCHFGDHFFQIRTGVRVPFFLFSDRFPTLHGVSSKILPLLLPYSFFGLDFGHDTTSIVTIFLLRAWVWARFSLYCYHIPSSGLLSGTILLLLLPYSFFGLGFGHDTTSIVTIFLLRACFRARYYFYCYHIPSSGLISGTILLLLLPFRLSFRHFPVRVSLSESSKLFS